MQFQKLEPFPTFCLHSKALKKIKPPPTPSVFAPIGANLELLVSNLKIVVELSNTMSVIVKGFEAFVKGFE
jgi:hypothetical protein